MFLSPTTKEYIFYANKKSHQFIYLSCFIILLIIIIGCSDDNDIFSSQDEIEYIHEDGEQFNNTTWQTVPGDACLPIIDDYQAIYAQYVQLDNSYSFYSQLVADAYQLKADRKNEEDDIHIIHSIIYLKKTSPRITEGIHTASFYFQIPSFTTGITVEGGLFIWMGNIRLDYGTAFQLIVDKDNSDYEKIFYWSGNKWIDSHKKVHLTNDFFYKITFTLNITNLDASIDFDGNGESFTLSDVFSETEKDDSWTMDTVARLQAECISKNGIKHIVNFKDCYWSQNF